MFLIISFWGLNLNLSARRVFTLYNILYITQYILTAIRYVLCNLNVKYSNMANLVSNTQNLKFKAIVIIMIRRLLKLHYTVILKVFVSHINCHSNFSNWLLSAKLCIENFRYGTFTIFKLMRTGRKSTSSVLRDIDFNKIMWQSPSGMRNLSFLSIFHYVCSLE